MTYPLPNRNWCKGVALVLSLLFLGLTRTDAQRRRAGDTTGFDDVVFGIAFSPDGRTLAVARGASEPSQRFGRVELWDTDTETLRHVIKGFDGPVRSVSFSPDGQTLVSGSSEFRPEKIQEKARSREGEVFSELKWWDPQTGELKHKLTLPGDGNFSVRATCSPDGKQLAILESFLQFNFVNNSAPFSAANAGIGSRGGFPNNGGFRSFPLFLTDLKLLDAQTGEIKFKLKAGQPREVMFSPDGLLLAVATANEVKVWNTQTGTEVRKLKGFSGAPNAIAFSPDGKRMAVASAKFERKSAGRFIKMMARSEVKLFDTREWTTMIKLQDLGAINSLAFEPTGRFLLLGGLLDQKEGSLPALRLHDLQTGKIATFPTGGEDFSEAVDDLAVSVSGNLLAFKAGPQMVRLLNTQTWKIKQTLDAKSAGEDNQRTVSRFLVTVNRVSALAFQPDGKTLSGEIEGHGIRLWDVRTGEVKKRVEDKDSGSALLAISPNGAALAEAGEDQPLSLWNIGDDRKRLIPQAPGQSATALALSTEGQLLAVSAGQDLIVWNARSGEKLFTLSGHQSTITRLVFANDDHTLASADEGGAIRLWDLTTGQTRTAVNTGGKVTALGFAPGGQVLASGGEDKLISLWDTRTGASQGKLKKHEATVNALAYSADGTLLASGSDDRTVIIWEMPAGKSKRTLKGHDQTVLSLAFSPDGSLIASGSGNASVVLWEVKSGKLNRVLH